MKKLLIVLVLIGPFAHAHLNNEAINTFTLKINCNSGHPMQLDYFAGNLRLIYQDDKFIEIPMTEEELAMFKMNMEISVTGATLDLAKRTFNGTVFEPSIIGIDKDHTLVKIEFASVAKVPGAFYFGENFVDSGYVELTLLKNTDTEKTLHHITIDRTTLDRMTSRNIHTVEDCYTK